jgi:hypothetical protein
LPSQYQHKGAPQHGQASQGEIARFGQQQSQPADDQDAQRQPREDKFQRIIAQPFARQGDGQRAGRQGGEGQHKDGERRGNDHLCAPASSAIFCARRQLLLDLRQAPAHLHELPPEFGQVVNALGLFAILGNQPRLDVVAPGFLGANSISELRRSAGLFGYLALHPADLTFHHADLLLQGNTARFLAVKLLSHAPELIHDQRIEFVLLCDQRPHVPLGRDAVPGRAKPGDERPKHRKTRPEDGFL